MSGKRDRLYFEAMRILACFFVIFNHTEVEGFFLYLEQEQTSLRFWWYLLVSVVCKFSVPLFFAVSGALLLVKEEPVKDIWVKRIGKIAADLLLFSFGIYLWEVLRGRQVFSLRTFFIYLYAFEWNPPYWYLYAFIPFLMSLPLLRPLVKNLPDRAFLYMFGLALIFDGILPVAEYVAWKGQITLNGNLRTGWLTSNIVLYPCLGYFLEYRVDIRTCKRKLIGLWSLNILTLLLTGYMTCYEARVTGLWDEWTTQTFFNAFVMIDCAAVFLTVKYLFTRYKLPGAAGRLMASVGSCTFGIYLLHIHVLPKVRLSWIGDLLRESSGLDAMLTAFILCALTMAAAYVPILLLKRLPVLKKLL